MAESMPKFFDVAADGHGVFRPTGDWTLHDITEAINDVIRYCRGHQIRCLLVDVKEAWGFDSPSVGERFRFMSRWAETSQGRVIVSVVARPEMILEDKLGVLIVRNRGMIADVEPDEEKALDWLDTACMVKFGHSRFEKSSDQ